MRVLQRIRRRARDIPCEFTLLDTIFWIVNRTELARRLALQCGRIYKDAEIKGRGFSFNLAYCGILRLGEIFFLASRSGMDTRGALRIQR